MEFQRRRIASKIKEESLRHVLNPHDIHMLISLCGVAEGDRKRVPVMNAE